MDSTSVNSTTTQNEAATHSRHEQRLSSEALEDRERRLASSRARRQERRAVETAEERETRLSQHRAQDRVPRVLSEIVRWRVSNTKSVIQCVTEAPRVLALGTKVLSG